MTYSDANVSRTATGERKTAMSMLVHAAQRKLEMGKNVIIRC